MEKGLVLDPLLYPRPLTVSHYQLQALNEKDTLFNTRTKTMIITSYYVY